MAAYAAVVSLARTMEQIPNHAYLGRILAEMELGSMSMTVRFLQSFLESYSHNNSKEVQDLERQIARASHAAEDLIESGVADRILGRYPSFSDRPDLQKVKADMDSIMAKAREIQDMGELKNQRLPRYSKEAASLSQAPPSGKIAMVGLEDEQIQIMGRLTEGLPSRQVIPIVGMGGIGKTTIAKSVYDNPLIMRHFDRRIWITISQEYTVRDLLLQIPICLKKQEDCQKNLNDYQLGEVLYKDLFGRRYLVVMDDMWGLEPWDSINCFFPDDGNMGRIIVTTRLFEVATQFDPCSLNMNFLDQDGSWELFCLCTFGQDGCPPELEEIGKQIVGKCEGLPLTIVVLGGLLAKSCWKQENWESVAEDINSILSSGDDEHCQNVLSLSYNHLSPHLKPCFLYMSIFPEDRKIRVSQLIKLWIAEGFLKSDQDVSLEEVAGGYLKDLVDRNLVLVSKWGLNGEIKACYMHDLVRDLCIRMAQSEDFTCILKSVNILQQDVHMMRRIAFDVRSLKNKQHPQVFHDAMQSVLVARTVMQIGALPKLENKLLRVLDAVDLSSLKDVFRQINLRYIACHLRSVPEFPASMCRLWNLQTIICHNIFPVSAPVEIWNMKQLRHIEFSELFLPDPLGDGILGNLQTLMKIVNFKCTTEVVRRIPHIKKLGIKYVENENEVDNCLQDLYCFKKLESLTISFFIKHEMKSDLQRNLTFPYSLKKLSLDNIEFCWADLTMISYLSDLEVLKLQGSIVGPQWNPFRGGFRSLKSLRILAYTDVVSWNADDSYFPVLENLDLGCVPRLGEIPLSIGEIPTLKMIHLGCCMASAAVSALKMVVEQENYGNEDLRVRVSFKDESEESDFRAMVEPEELTRNNFLVEGRYR